MTLDAGLVPARFVEPTPNATLSGPIVVLRWDIGDVPIESAVLLVGSADGLSDYARVTVDTDTATSLSGLPTDGGPVAARLWYRLPGGWRSISAAYRAPNSSPRSPLRSPEPGTTLSGSTATFRWDTPEVEIEDSWLYLGSAPGLSDVTVVRGGVQREATVGGLPTDGSELHATLYLRVVGVWHRFEAAFPTEAVDERPPSRRELVQELQRLVGVADDGVIGPATRAALNRHWLGRAASFDPSFAALFVDDPDLIRWAQRRLKALGASGLAIDGIYTLDTERAAANQLGRSGVIAAESFLALLGL